MNVTHKFKSVQSGKTDSVHNPRVLLQMCLKKEPEWKEKTMFKSRCVSLNVGNKLRASARLSLVGDDRRASLNPSRFRSQAAGTAETRKHKNTSGEKRLEGRHVGMTPGNHPNTHRKSAGFTNLNGAPNHQRALVFHPPKPALARTRGH